MYFKLHEACPREEFIRGLLVTLGGVNCFIRTPVAVSNIYTLPLLLPMHTYSPSRVEPTLHVLDGEHPGTCMQILCPSQPNLVSFTVNNCSGKEGITLYSQELPKIILSDT